MTGPVNPYGERLRNVRASLRGIDALFVSNLVNVRYLTGFQGSSGFVLISRKKAFFITDARYGKEAIQSEFYETVIWKRKLFPLIKKLAEKANVKLLGFEETISYAFYEKLEKTGLALKPVKGLLEKIRAVKDKEEQAKIKEAVNRAERALLKVRPFIRAGTSEIVLARRLEEQLRKECYCTLPFPIIVAGGPNSAIPHAMPGERKFAPGDLVIIDWGSEYEGYCSDISRTFLLKESGLLNTGSINKDSGLKMPEKRKIFSTVLKAQKAAMEFAAPGRRAKDIDNSARYVIKQADYGAFFVHSLGHGVGLQVHEFPRISALSADKVKRGMIFTVEPGIYVPGIGGVRIEDMVCLDNGARVLTSLPRDLRSNTI